MEFAVKSPMVVLRVAILMVLLSELAQAKDTQVVESSPDRPRETIVMQNVDARKALAAIQLLENRRDKLKTTQGFPGNTEVRTQVSIRSGPALRDGEVTTLSFGIDTNYRLLGSDFATAKVFTIEYDAKTKQLSGRIDWGGASKGDYNVKLSASDLKLGVPGVSLDGIPKARFGFSRSKASLVVRNLSSTLTPYFEIEKSGKNGNIAIAAGVSFKSQVDKSGVVSPGTRSNLDLDMSVDAIKAGGDFKTSGKRVDGQVDVVVRGDVRSGVKADTAAIVSIAGQNKPRGLSRLSRLFRQSRGISATYLDARNRVTYTVSGHTVESQSTQDYTKRHLKVKAIHMPGVQLAFPTKSQHISRKHKAAKLKRAKLRPSGKAKPARTR